MKMMPKTMRIIVTTTMERVKETAAMKKNPKKSRNPPKLAQKEKPKEMQ